MNSKTTLPITEARAKIYEMAEKIGKTGNKYYLTERGKPTLVVMSLEEFESWQETLAVMREMPDLAEEIMRDGKEKILSEKGMLLQDYLRKRGFDKLASKYEAKIYGRGKTKGTKTTR